MDDTLIPHPIGTASIRQGDALNLPLADESVDLIVTSPPYFALRSYTDGGEHYDGQIGSEATPQEFLEALWAVTRECKRVLKPSGSMWVNLGDKYVAGTSAKRPASSPARDAGLASGQAWHETDRRLSAEEAGVRTKSLMGLPWRYALGCIDDLDLILRAEVVWSKPNGLPESVTDRVRRSHEQWFHFTKEPRYFAAVDEVREPHTGGSNHGRKDKGESPRNAALAETGDHGRRKSNTDPDLFNPLGKLPGSVWTIPSEPLRVPEHIGVDHFAAFPQEWPRRIILGWSPRRVCRDCGCPLVESPDGTRTTAVRGMWRADHGGGDHRPRIGDESTSQEQVLQPDVLQPSDGTSQSVDAGVGADDEGLHSGAGPESPDGGSDGVRAPASSRDGGALGPGADPGRGGAPQERRPSGQQDREPRTAAEEAARQEVRGDEEAPHRVPLLRSRGPKYGGCPQCGSEASRPSVILDPFGGTGTVAMVARALGRYGVHIDLSRDYNRLARWRVWQSGHEYKTHAREWAQRNDSWDKKGKPKVPAKIRRQIEAEMADRAREGRRMERDHWNTVRREVHDG